MGKIFEQFEQIDIFGNTEKESIELSLFDKFIIPPFSIFDSRQGYWQNRKRTWIALGIKSEIGRDSKCYHIQEWANQKAKSMPNDISIFDPVLCEICYKWFNTEKGKILDPFAGGSVRGIVANKLGYEYIGIDLRQEQVDANYENAKDLKCNPTWYCDDAINLNQYVSKESVDMIFTCPPYFYLEDYKWGDQSYKKGKTYQEWLDNYMEPTIKNIYDYLIDSGYFCMNINNFDKFKLVQDVKTIAEKVGFKLFNCIRLDNIQRINEKADLNDNSEKIMIFVKPNHPKYNQEHDLDHVNKLGQMSLFD